MDFMNIPTAYRQLSFAAILLTSILLLLSSEQSHANDILCVNNTQNKASKIARCLVDIKIENKDPLKNLEILYRENRHYNFAFHWFGVAANQKHVLAQYYLGIMYFFGKGTTKNYTLAEKWFSKAASQNHSDSQRYLGDIYSFNKDNKHALYWYRKSAEQNNAVAQRKLAILFRTGPKSIRDFEEAEYWFRKAIKHNDIESNYQFGKMYLIGEGVRQDYKLAYRYFIKAANKGHQLAQYELALMNQRGLGVKKNELAAAAWFKKSALNGHLQSQLILGSLYSNGKRIKKDNSEAFKWYMKAAKQNSQSAQINVGLMYKGGLGVKRNHKQALKWFYKAAHKNNKVAQYQVGRMYESGYGVKKDVNIALDWYQKSSKNGYKLADEKYIQVIRQLDFEESHDVANSNVIDIEYEEEESANDNKCVQLSKIGPIVSNFCTWYKSRSGEESMSNNVTVEFKSGYQFSLLDYINRSGQVIKIIAQQIENYSNRYSQEVNIRNCLLTKEIVNTKPKYVKIINYLKKNQCQINFLEPNNFKHFWVSKIELDDSGKIDITKISVVSYYCKNETTMCTLEYIDFKLKLPKQWTPWLKTEYGEGPYEVHPYELSLH